MLQEDDVLNRATEPPFLSALHVKNDTTNLFYYKLGESTDNKQSSTFLLRKGKKFNLLTVPFKPLRCCLRSDTRCSPNIVTVRVCSKLKTS